VLEEVTYDVAERALCGAHDIAHRDIRSTCVSHIDLSIEGSIIGWRAI